MWTRDDLLDWDEIRAATANQKPGTYGWADALVDAVVAKLNEQAPLDPTPMHEEWGLRYLNLKGEPVYIADDGRESAEGAKGDGDVLVSRFVSDWQPAD